MFRLRDLPQPRRQMSLKLAGALQKQQLARQLFMHEAIAAATKEVNAQ